METSSNRFPERSATCDTRGSPSLRIRVSKLGLILLLASALHGCPPPPPPPPPPGTLVPNANEVDFGNVLLTTSADQTLDLENVGQGNVNVVGAAIGGQEIGRAHV